ncbi:MAG: TraU family protein [Syntrophales bacterium]|nr:TraU family protein [Syntrophales bacterium]
MKGLLVLFVLFHAVDAQAVCRSGIPLNPVTDLCWQCIFPVSIAGIEIIPGPSENNVPDLSGMPVCTCPAPPPLFIRIGIPVSFWEPARYVETVKDPYCFPSLGLGLSSEDGFLGGGSQELSNASVDTSTFAQAHYFIYPVWSIMELLTDLICVEHSGFDVAYLTEVDPLWQNDILAFILEPESILFANPVAQTACIADGVSTNAGMSMSPLFWCIGSGGSAYPLTGHVNDDNELMANSTIAARMVYKLAREGLVCDPALYLCACVPTPIWVKHNYRMHIAKPVRDFMCHPFGRTGLVWGALKNPPLVGDNFVWQLFRRRSCCAF